MVGFKGWWGSSRWWGSRVGRGWLDLGGKGQGVVGFGGGWGQGGGGDLGMGGVKGWWGV